MASSQPLTGIELVDCAKSNAEHGLAIASHQCGFGTDTNRFLDALRTACSGLGIKVQSLEDLITEQQRVISSGGIEIAPDSKSEL
ncbi:hypothetical protein [Pseudanabaena sp. FACHB-2040]|uniref:hypothetical protein n=1 Tax=Pseudanabaena sp. FACHB-2040 TaxID=2692859 RepID=UPI0016893327|nr:hypothetical protein [Pseudanabaena sp. FACHB-2040]MBD0267605.1 hypothetical protein [Cyanobacteria bacterium Co-bin8]MBD2258957.1 hypothetical protein [Pseudanabaena sp. FACHB-2040]